MPEGFRAKPLNLEPQFFDSSRLNSARTGKSLVDDEEAHSMGGLADAAGLAGLIAASISSPIAIGSLRMTRVLVVPLSTPLAMFAGGALTSAALCEIVHADEHAKVA
ncbi:hypothetical protein [Planctomycetes bacterium TBK1r]|uniref:hypothetical protein n=1 Tax=Stieleria magnilauensis TaxID=2527963 RepID=UPI0011A47E26